MMDYQDKEIVKTRPSHKHIIENKKVAGTVFQERLRYSSSRRFWWGKKNGLYLGIYWDLESDQYSWFIGILRRSGFGSVAKSDKPYQTFEEAAIDAVNFSKNYMKVGENNA